MYELFVDEIVNENREKFYPSHTYFIDNLSYDIAKELGHYNDYHILLLKDIAGEVQIYAHHKEDNFNIIFVYMNESVVYSMIEKRVIDELSIYYHNDIVYTNFFGEILAVEFYSDSLGKTILLDDRITIYHTKNPIPRHKSNMKSANYNQQ